MWMIATGDQSAALLILEPDDIQRMKAGDFLSPGPETLALQRSGCAFHIGYSPNVPAVRAAFERGAPAEEIMELL